MAPGPVVPEVFGLIDAVANADRCGILRGFLRPGRGDGEKRGGDNKQGASDQRLRVPFQIVTRNPERPTGRRGQPAAQRRPGDICDVRAAATTERCAQAGLSKRRYPSEPIANRFQLANVRGHQPPLSSIMSGINPSSANEPRCRADQPAR
jgi:hypothetical protein